MNNEFLIMNFKDSITDMNRACSQQFNGFGAAGTGDDNRGNGSVTG